MFIKNNFLRFLFLVVISAMLLSVSSFASGQTDSSDEAGSDTDFEEQSWDELVEQLVEKCKGNTDTVALGYCNTVTGETHFYNPDSYFVVASLYKAPLNMYYAEQITLGNFSWDDMINDRTYKDVQEASLIYSNNPYSHALVDKLGGWTAFKEKIAPYLGVDPEENKQYLSTVNSYTVRQMTTCMTLLAQEGDRFPGVVDCLLQSAPGLFLEYADVPYEIAQKYGNINEDHLFHAAGIVYTDDPIALVIITSNLADQKGIFAGYVELMCDYTQYFTEKRLTEEAMQASEAASTAEEDETASGVTVNEEVQEEATAEEPALEESAPDETESRNDPLAKAIVVGAALLVAIVASATLTVLINRKRRK